MPRITENNIHHWVNDFLKVNVTLLILILILVLIGLQTQQVCDKTACHTPKIVEDTYTIKGIELNQYFGDKMPVVGGAQLSSLSNAFIRTGEGITKYSQYLRFKGDGTGPIESGAAFFGSDGKGVVDDYLHFNQKTDIYEYGIIFEKGLHSAIQGKKLIDLVNEPLLLFGNEAYVVDAIVDTDNKKLTLKIINAQMTDILAEGQERAYKIGKKAYEVKVLVIDNNANVKLIVNGYETKTLRKGDITILPDQTIIGIAEVLLNEAGEGSDLVKFYFGSTMIEATDKYSDTGFSYEMNSQKGSLHSAKVQYIGMAEGTTFTLSSMKFRVEASSKQGDVYVPSGSSLRKHISEPDAMFPDSWDIVYNGFGMGEKRAGILPLEFSPTGDGFNLLFSNIHGMRYSIPLVSARDGFSYGDGKRTLHFTEAPSSTTYPIAKNDFFIVTSQNNEQGTTNVLAYDGIDIPTKRIFFHDFAQGQKTVPYEELAGYEGKAILNVGGYEYPVFISSEAGNPISVDLNGDGVLSGGEANIVIAGGGKLDINAISGSTAIIRLVVPARLLNGAGTDEVTEIKITKDEHSVDIDVPNQGDLRLSSATDKDILIGQTKFGTLFQINRRKTTSSLFVDFPRKQALASVTINVQSKFTQ